MRHRLTTLFLLGILFSCQVESPEISPAFTGEKVILNVVGSTDTKVSLSDTPDGAHIFNWAENGEKIALVERIKFKGQKSFTYVRIFKSDGNYQVNGNTASFRFELDKIANEIDECQYYLVSPYNALTTADINNFIINLESTQVCSTLSPGDESIILFGSKTGLSCQGGNISLDNPFGPSFTGFGQITINNLNVATGTQIRNVLIQSSKKMCGQSSFYYSGGLCSDSDALSNIQLKPSSSYYSNNQATLRFATFPTNFVSGDVIKVSVITDDKIFTKHIILSSSMSFPAGELTKFSVNMTGVIGTETSGFINGTVIEPDTHYAGLVTDKETGKAIAGINVTDGTHYSKTDNNGVYQLAGDAETRFIYYSLPSEYKLPLDNNNQPYFWAAANPGAKFERHDFELSKRESVDDCFNLVAVSDIHFFGPVTPSSPSVHKAFSTTTAVELNNEIESISENGHETIIINTGDLLTNLTKEYEEAKARIKEIKLNGKPVPFFNVIGNHDHTNAGKSDYESTANYCAEFGPTDYSFNIGKAHIVCMDNVIFTGVREGGYGFESLYRNGFTDKQIQWLNEDLSTIKNKSETLLILCVHVPIRYYTGDENLNFQSIRDHYSDFKNVLVLSGHRHIMMNYSYNEIYTTKSGKLPKEFTMPPLGGVWRANINRAGDPNGYYVFTAKGADLPNHYFKAVGHSKDFQFRIYRGSDVYHSPVIVDGKTYSFAWSNVTSTKPATGKYLVRVFDGDSERTETKVWLVKKGSSKDTWTRMSGISISGGIVDACASSYLYNNIEANTTYLTSKQKSYWYIDGDPKTDTDWYVAVSLVQPDGTSTVYKSSTYQSGYEGF